MDTPFSFAIVITGDLEKTMYDHHTIGFAIGLQSSGKNAKEVAEIMRENPNVPSPSIKTVERWMKAVKKDGQVVRKKSSGRPLKLSQSEIQHLKVTQVFTYP